jgi:selenocysteine lyase/cysteine desulfurase
MRPLLYKDAIFVSPHKFIGGPGANGVLVAKKRLFANAVPTNPGGGTVFFVTGDDHRYLNNREEREEGGTPDIIGAIRAGLVFALKRSVGAGAIELIEKAHATMAMKALAAHPNVCLLGSPSAPRLPIFSFLIRCPTNQASTQASQPADSKDAQPDVARFLHYNYTAALLNDLFGVQCRGGCQCAGPYGLELLGIDMSTARRFEDALIDKQECLRPGFARISLPYFLSSVEVRRERTPVPIARLGRSLLASRGVT